MTKRKSNAHEEASEQQTSTQRTALAQAESELQTALSIADAANQAAIWQFNSLGASDAFIDRKRHAALIERLTKASEEADAIKADADALVKSLREEVRQLTKSLGSKANDPQMKVERERAESTAQESAKAQVTAPPAKATKAVKPMTKTELVSEARKQIAKKQTATQAHSR